MDDTSSRWFGLIVAYLVPGFIGLAGVSPFLPEVGEWLQPVSWGDWGIGPTIYALLAATGVGMIVSCFRWAIVDQVMPWVGVPRANYDFRQLEARVNALDYLAKNHYIYYQNHANMLVASIWAYLVHRIFQTSPLLGFGTDLAMLVMSAVLFAGARDALRRYRKRSQQLLS